MTLTAIVQGFGSAAINTEQLEQVTVTGTINRPDGETDVITFSPVTSPFPASQLWFQADYQIPASGPRGALKITARGLLDGAKFVRHADTVWEIPPANAAQFSSTVLDRLIDTTGDGRIDMLAVDIPLQITHPSTYTLAANLTFSNDQGKADNKQTVTSAATLLATTANGNSSATLLFPVAEIVKFATTNEMETIASDALAVTSATLSDIEAGDIPVAQSAVLHTITQNINDLLNNSGTVYLPTIHKQ